MTEQPRPARDWFERLVGFRETAYLETRSRLEVEGATLRSRVDGRSYHIGRLELASLADLRSRGGSGTPPRGRLRFRNMTADVRELHRSPDFKGAVFQVASQFNLLEMIGPAVTPEDGVTRYASDPTQGPACAIAAGAATIYRNYFAPVRDRFGEQIGQTAARQLDALADLGHALAKRLNRSPKSLWAMTNGYALATQGGLTEIAAHLTNTQEPDRDALRAHLRIGLHMDVQVTAPNSPPEQRVTQAFCSALPVAYSRLAPALWRPFAELILEASYEATLWAATLNAGRGGSNIVLLTRLGGGAFGNDATWIDRAIRRALTRFAAFELEVRMVNFGPTPAAMVALEREF